MKPLWDLDLTVRTTNLLLLVGIDSQEQLMSADIFELACSIYAVMLYSKRVMNEINDYRCNVVEFTQ
jgi:hypothetical protein